jgi:hypothetical protein
VTYISQTSREHIEPHLQSLSENIHTTGDLNYAVTRLSLRLLELQGIRYDNIAGIIGTLRLVADEMVRRLVVEFLDLRVEENGDLPEYADILLRLRTEGRRSNYHAPDVAQPHG